MTTTEPQDLITIKVDGKEVSVPKGTLIIRAAEKAGVHIPRFCDHPLLKPAAACRQCLVEVASPNRQGVVSKMPKPQPACAVTVSPQMEVYTGATSEVAKQAQHGIMEFLLINHPMDCPVCDKGGECPLQNQAMSDGREKSRFIDIKRTYPKPISVSSQILLDRDRCILCQRCTRFSTQIAGDAFIQLQGRGGGTPGSEVHALHGSQIGNFDACTLDFRVPGWNTSGKDCE
ncbi:2Fe-2S iron-sulfur cluster-binding protein [Arcanobacterium hippocoleae]